MPLVSVIMPAYNVDRYIDAAVQSVLAQTYPDFELIVIDDGSTDDTNRIVQSHMGRDPRVQLLQQPNGGISAARNFGLRTSRGSLVALLDGDDVWEPGFLESQVAILTARPDIDAVTGNAWFLGGPEHGRPARPVPDSRPAPDLPTMITDETAVFIMTVFRRRVYETIGGFDEALRTNEDYDYWLRAASAGFRFARNDRPLAHYRRRDDSLSAGQPRMINGILTVYRKLRLQLGTTPDLLAAVDAQIGRFERERLACEARDALAARDADAARSTLDALYAVEGGAALGVARVMARWTPGLLWKAYELRQQRQAAQHT